MSGGYLGDLTAVLAVLAALGAGLIAGTFFAFSSFVMQALGRQPAAQGIAAMQTINVTVINPWFLGAFIGTALLALAVAALGLWQGWAGSTPLLLGGALLYLVGCFGVTAAFNVPRNEALAKVAAESAEGAALWHRYLSGWTAWNHVRTAASLAAAACFILALA